MSGHSLRRRFYARKFNNACDWYIYDAEKGVTYETYQISDYSNTRRGRRAIRADARAHARSLNVKNKKRLAENNEVKILQADIAKLRGRLNALEPERIFWLKLSEEMLRSLSRLCPKPWRIRHDGSIVDPKGNVIYLGHNEQLSAAIMFLIQNETQIPPPSATK
ncbi:MAG: hypothetical protein ACHQUB_02685 [Candidatus Saccharimonadia bacterium]